MRLYECLKRVSDITLSFVLLICFAPLFLVVGLLIKLDSKGPVFFRQNRLGKNGSTFKVWKFRTMCENAESMGLGISTAEKDPRITRVGKFLRKSSIDELPQLINIVVGQMSFVGPRPAPSSHLKGYSVIDAQRLRVRPGITGWAQVNGRNKLTWAERIEKDVWYVDNLSLWLDIKIILLTIKVVICSEGVYSGRNDHRLEQPKNHNT